MARQPIFDRRQKLWGYELLYRDRQEATHAEIADKHQATLNVIANALVSPRRDLERGRKLLINFSRHCLELDLPFLLPPHASVVEVTEATVAGLAELENALERLRAGGYQLALDDMEQSDFRSRLLPSVDLFIVDCLGRNKEDIEAILDELGDLFKGRLMAKRLEDREHYEMAKNLGFELFQGFYFQRPEIVAGRRLSSAHRSRFQILKMLEHHEPHYEELAEAIHHDVTIGYRLLAYLNSAAFGMPARIKSLRHAIMLLGWRQVRQWMRLVILTDMSDTDKTCEQTYSAALRCRFLQLLCERNETLGLDSENLGLLGLLSLLDAILGVSMEQVVDALPLDPELAQALASQEHPLSSWIRLCQCFEHGEWDELDDLIAGLGLEPVSVADCYHDALQSTNSFFELTQ